MKNHNLNPTPTLTRALAVSVCLIFGTIGCNSAEDEEENELSGSNSLPNVSVQQVDNNTQQVSTDHDCSGSFDPEDITDLILATGQSNLIGPNTEVAATYDRFGNVVQFQEPDLPHPRVFAWTVDPVNNNAGLGWKIAKLTQSWHDSNPGRGGIADNNFAFHFAKQVAKLAKGCRIVGIVMVSEGGKGIAHWDTGAEGWNQVQRHLGEAMSAIGRNSIDGILWHQGESDWIEDGSCFPGDTCVNGTPDYYAQKLYSAIADPAIGNPYGGSALINRLRRESWFSGSTPFIAAETMKAPVNVHLRKLNTDNDKWTACIRGDAASGLEHNPNDPHKNHYSGEALRQIGRRYAREYMAMKQIEPN